MTKKYILTADDVVDNLTSTDSTVPLSANQGRALNTTKPDTLTGTSDPASDAGKNGDFYVKYVDGTPKTVSAMYNKIDGSWLKSSTGGSGGGTTYTIAPKSTYYDVTFDQLSSLALITLPPTMTCSGSIKLGYMGDTMVACALSDGTYSIQTTFAPIYTEKTFTIPTGTNSISTVIDSAARIYGINITAV